MGLILTIEKPDCCLRCPMRDGISDDCQGQSEENNKKAGSWEDLRKTCPIKTVDGLIKKVESLKKFEMRDVDTPLVNVNSVIEAIKEYCEY